MANVPVTGLSQLGNVLADFGQTYARNARQDQLLAQNRSQQLEDVASQRQYQDTVRREERGARMEDAEKMMILQARHAMLTVFQHEGLLAPGQENDPTAIQRASEEFQRRGLDKMYADLQQTLGDDGQPLLRPEQLTDVAAIQEAKRKFGLLKGQLLQEDITAKRQTRAGGQAAAERAAVSEKDLDDQIKRLTDELQKTVPQPTQNEIVSRARQLWLIAHPNERAAPTDTGKLGPEIQQAAKELSEARFIQAKEQKDRIQQEIFLIRQQRVAQTAESGGLAKLGFFAQPNAAPPPPPGMGLLDTGGFQPVSRPAESADFLNFVRQPGAAKPAPAPTAPPPNPLGLAEQAGMFQRPMIQQGRNRSFAPETPEMVEQAAQAIEAELGRVAQLTPSRATVGRQAYLQDILQKLQPARRAAPGGVNVLTPPVPNLNTATESTPMPAFASPGSMAPSTSDWWKVGR